MSDFCIYIFRTVIGNDIFWYTKLGDPMVKKFTENVNCRGGDDGVYDDVMCKCVNDDY